MKRLAVPLCTIVVLLAIAGILEFLLLMYPAQSKAVAAVEQTEVRQVIGHIERVAQHPETAGYESEEAKRAGALVEAGTIVADGTALDEALAGRIAASHADYTKHVGSISQQDVLPSGCEIVALAVALRSEGIEADPAEIAEQHLRTGKSVATDYIGSPKSDGGGLPPCIVDAANSWLSAHAQPGRAFDLTGTTFEGACALVSAGYPVITWITENLEEPTFDTAGEGLRWYSPEHCVVFYAVNGEQVLVSDSLAGLVSHDRAHFSRIYESCGNKAMFVVAS